MMEGLSLAYLIIYKRGGSFSYDLIHIIGWIHSIMDEVHVPWYSIRYRSDSICHSNKHIE